MCKATVRAVALAQACMQLSGRRSDIGVESLCDELLSTAQTINKLVDQFDQSDLAVEFACIVEQIVFTTTNADRAPGERPCSDPPNISAHVAGNECVLRLSKREGRVSAIVNGHATSLNVQRYFEREVEQLVLGIKPPEADTQVLRFSVNSLACDSTKEVSCMITHVLECSGDAVCVCACVTGASMASWREGLAWRQRVSALESRCNGHSVRMRWDSMKLSPPADTVSTMQQWVRQMTRNQSDRADSLPNLMTPSWLRRLEINVGATSDRSHSQPYLQHHQKPVAAGMQLDVHLAQQPVVRLRVQDMICGVDTSVAAIPSACSATISLNLGSLELLDLLQEASLYPILLAIHPNSATANGPREPEARAVALTLRVLPSQQTEVEFSAVVGTCRFLCTKLACRYLFGRLMTPHAFLRCAWFHTVYLHTQNLLDTTTVERVRL